MKPYAELLEFNQPNPIRLPGFTRIRDSFAGLREPLATSNEGDMDPLVFMDPERIMEFAGRWDYGENNARKLGEKVTVVTGTWDGGTEVPIIQKYIGMGHESMIEMGDATFFIECSRVVSHELVRHRIASFQQESQRFVKYDDESLKSEDLFYDADGLDIDIRDTGETAGSYMESHYNNSIWMYREMRAAGVPPQIARYVLPNAMRTRLIMKTNIREWRHILRLRMDKSAQPEMQELMRQIYDQLVMVFPNALTGVADGERGVR